MDVDPIALWRYQVIAPLLAESHHRGSLIRHIRRLCQQEHIHPRRGPLRLATRTLEDWLYSYRKQGLAGLLPTRRKDRGQSRRIDPALAARIEALVQSHPKLDGPGLLAELAAQDGAPPPSLSTLYRFLHARGLDRYSPPPRADHRAYAFDLAGDCWQGDCLAGPAIPQPNGVRRKTHLLAFLDDASRLIPHAQFYFDEHLASLRDGLKQAFLKRGLPRRLYFDNAHIFRSHALLGVCATLGIQLLHTRPYKPQGRAKLERFFLTVRESFLARLELNLLTTLPELNRLLWAWIEGQYHQTPHRGLGGLTPLSAWTRSAGGIRALPPQLDLDFLFLDHTHRRVAKDGTLTLDGKRFEAGPAFIGQKVHLRFDPYDLRKVFLLRSGREPLPIFPVDLAGNRRLQRNPEPPPPASGPIVPLRALQDLARRMENPEPSSPSENPIP
jgi:transposase InsO family protein